MNSTPTPALDEKESPMPAAEPMSQEIINRLKELLAKATPGRLLYCQTYGCAAELVAADTPGDRVIAISPEVVCEDDDQTRIDFEAMQAAWNFVRDNTSTLATLTPSGVERIRAEAFEEAAKVAADIRTGVSGEYGLGFDRAAEDIASAIRALALPSEPPSQGDVEGRARELERECDWPADGFFTFRDEPGEHDPCYVVMPGGAMLPLNHHAGTGVDIARAKFIVSACNAALFSGGLYKAHFATPTVETAALQWFVGFEWEPRSVRESNFAVAGFRAGAEWALASKEDGRS